MVAGVRPETSSAWMTAVSVSGSVPTISAGAVVPSSKETRISPPLAGHLHHVVVGEDPAVRGQDDARAGAGALGAGHLDLDDRRAAPSRPPTRPSRRRRGRGRSRRSGCSCRTAARWTASPGRPGRAPHRRRRRRRRRRGRPRARPPRSPYAEDAAAGRPGRGDRAGRAGAGSAPRRSGTAASGTVRGAVGICVMSLPWPSPAVRILRVSCGVLKVGCVAGGQRVAGGQCASLV